MWRTLGLAGLLACQRAPAPVTPEAPPPTTTAPAPAPQPRTAPVQGDGVCAARVASAVDAILAGHGAAPHFAEVVLVGPVLWGWYGDETLGAAGWSGERIFDARITDPAAGIEAFVVGDGMRHLVGRIVAARRQTVAAPANDAERAAFAGWLAPLEPGDEVVRLLWRITRLLVVCDDAGRIRALEAYDQ